MISKIIYHGSPLKKDILIPKQAKGTKIEDSLKGVYATTLEEFAIVRAILLSKGVKGPISIDISSKVQGIISGGWPEAEEIYLYSLDPISFKNLPKNSHQYISFKEVKPIKIETLKVNDYLHLIKLK